MAARARPTSSRSVKARIPTAFSLMGHRIRVRRIPPSKWKMADAVGYFDPARMSIGVCTGASVSTQEQAFWHEAMHAVLYCLGSPDYGNEQFVDQMGGLIHQLVTSAEHRPCR